MVNVSFQSLLSGGKVNPSSATSHTYILGPQEINFNLREKKKLKKALAEKYDFSNPSRTNLGKATLFWNAYGCQSAAELESDQLLLAQVHLLLFTEKLHPGHPCRPGVKPHRSWQCCSHSWRRPGTSWKRHKFFSRPSCCCTWGSRTQAQLSEQPNECVPSHDHSLTFCILKY